MSTEDDTVTIVTCIKCDEKMTVNGEERVILDGRAKSGPTAFFLEDPEKIAGTNNYHAKKVDYKEAKTRIFDKIKGIDRIPLFCVHGYLNEPNDIIDEVVDDRKKFQNTKYFPVFVIWPVETLYTTSTDKNATDSGKAFFDFVKSIPDETFPRKSLMMHSMGNHVVFDGVCFVGPPKVQFENIFMVAADVPHDGFHKNPDEGYRAKKDKEIWGFKNDKAKNFYQMLAKNDKGLPKGKVVVLFNDTDKALIASSWTINQERRLGQNGMGTERTWRGSITSNKNLIRDEFKNCHANEDCNAWAGSYFGTAHSYKFHEKSIEIYQKYAL